MCGRFALTLPDDAMARLFDAALGAALMPGPRYNICPTQMITTVVSRADGRRLLPMRWGFLPTWYGSDRDGPVLINARAETIDRKPAFRRACRERRCLIPATGYFEWLKSPEGTRLPIYIHPAKAEFITLAGIWQDWEAPDGRVLSTCAIVTTQASEALASIHHRMPVMIDPADHALWLGERGRGAAVLMHPAPRDALRFHRVADAINSGRAEGSELIEPMED
ncbi:MAG: SOS response-associated peptidase [Paracoccaceae bacterium]